MDDNKDFKRNLSSYVFQVKLLFVFLWEAFQNNFTQFQLGTEIKDAEKFDDIVLSYLKEDEKIYYRYVQVKYGRFDGMVLRYIDFVGDHKTVKFDVKKYYTCYRKIKLRKEENQIEYLALSTNIPFGQLELKKNALNKLTFDQVSAEKCVEMFFGWKAFQFQDFKTCNELMEKFHECTNLKLLADEILEYIFKDDKKAKLDIKNYWISSYFNVLLKENIIEEREICFFTKAASDSLKPDTVAIMKKIEKFKKIFNKIFFDETGTAMPNDLYENIKFEKPFIDNLMAEKDHSQATMEDAAKILVNHILKNDYEIPNKSFDIWKDLFTTMKVFVFNANFIDDEKSSIDANNFYQILLAASNKIVMKNLQNFSFFAVNAMEDLEQYETAPQNSLINEDTQKVAAEALVQHIFYKKTITDIFKPEYVFLKDVFESKDITRFQFTKKFATDLNHQHFRDKFLELYFKEILKNASLKLNVNFGKLLSLVKELKKSFDNAKVQKIQILKLDKKNWNEIDGLIEALNGSIFIATEERNKIKFRPSFISDPESVNQNPWAKKFKEFLINDGKAKTSYRFLQNEFEDLKNYTIEFENYPPYFDELKENEDINDEIEEFRKLLYIVTAPNDLTEIVGKKMGETFNLLDADIISNEFFLKVMDWAKAVENTLLNEKDVQKFKQDIGNTISSLLQTGCSTQYFEKIKEYGISFNEPLKSLQQFLNLSESSKVLVVNTAEPLLTRIKAAETLKLRNPKDGKIIFYPLSTLIRMKKHALNSFRSKNNFLVIIDKKTNEDLTSLCDELINIIKNPKKKIVIITADANTPLLLALKNTSNTDFVKNVIDKTEYTDLTPDSQAKIVDETQINFQGNNVLLKNIVNKNEFPRLIDPQTLQKIINGDEIIIGSPPITFTESEEDCYVQRKFRLIKVRNDIFEDKELQKNNLFLVDGPNAFNFLQSNQIDQNQIIDANSFIKNQIDHQKIFITLQKSPSKAEFSKIVKKCPNLCVHWLKLVNNTLLWFHSYVPSSLSESWRTFESCICRDEECSTESFFWEYVKQNPFVIISDIAGMGKSTILTSLLKALNNNEIWKLRINLNQYTRVLANLKARIDHSAAELLQAKLNLNFDNFDSDYGKLILESPFTSETHENKNISFENKLFAYLFTQRGILYVFDGFDEINPDYGDIVLNLLQILKKNERNRIWITSRTNFKGTLEQTFGTFAYDMKPFDREDQVNFLTQFWISIHKREKGIETPNQEYFLLYAGSLLALVSITVGDIIGIPLQTRMLAEIFQENHDENINQSNSSINKCIEFVNRDREPDQYKIVLTKFHVSLLFESFFEKKIFKYFLQQKGIVELTKPYAEKLKKNVYSVENCIHKIFGYLALIDKNVDENLLTENEKQQINDWLNDFHNGIENVGIINSFNSDGCPLFTHFTYAEYFAACFLVDKLCTASSNVKKVFKVANEIFKKDVPIFLQCFLYKLGEHFHNPEFKAGLNGKNFLMFSAENGLVNCVNVFLNYSGFNGGFPVSDLFGKTIFDYAAENGHIDLVVYITCYVFNLIHRNKNQNFVIFHYLSKYISNHDEREIYQSDISNFIKDIKKIAENHLKPKNEETFKMVTSKSYKKMVKKGGNVSNAAERMKKDVVGSLPELLKFFSATSIKIILNFLKPTFLTENGLDSISTNTAIDDIEKIDIFEHLLKNVSDKNYYIRAMFLSLTKNDCSKLLDQVIKCGKFTFNDDILIECFFAAATFDYLETIKIILPNIQNKNSNELEIGDEINAHLDVLRFPTIKYIFDELNPPINNINILSPLRSAVLYNGSLKAIKYLVEEKGANIFDENSPWANLFDDNEIYETIGYIMSKSLEHWQKNGPKFNGLLRRSESASMLNEPSYFKLLQKTTNIPPPFSSTSFEEKHENVNENDTRLFQKTEKLSEQEEACFEAARQGNFEFLQLPSRPSFYVKDATGKRLIHYAIIHQNMEAIKKLLSRSVFQLERSDDTISPLFCAAQTDNIEILKFFIKKHKFRRLKFLEIQNRCSSYLWQIDNCLKFVLNEDYESLKKELEMFEDNELLNIALTVSSTYIFDILHYAKTNFELAIILLQKGVILQALLKDVTFLRQYVGLKMTKMLTIFYQLAIYVMSNNIDQKSIINYFDNQLLKELKFFEICPNVADEIIKNVRFDFDIEVFSKFSLPPSNPDLNDATDLNESLTKGGTLLHIAAAANKKEIVDWLIKKGADPKAKDHDGLNACDLAEKYNSSDVLSYFLSLLCQKE